MTTEWTVMGYLAGDNNLNEEMVLTLQEMLAFGVWDRVKIMAQLDPTGMGLPTQRYVFDTTAPNVTPDNMRYLETYLQDPPVPPQASNTGNPAALSGFVGDMMNAGHASDHYHALILSGHGSGSTEDFLLRDDNPVDSLSIPELTTALTDANGSLPGGKKLDLLGLDCCFMSMIEVYYQIRDLVDFIVGAESMVPDFGWPYHRILAKAEEIRDFDNNPAGPPIEPKTLADIMVKEYIDFYSDYDLTAGRSVDLAAVKAAELASLKKPVKQLAKALTTAVQVPVLEDQIHLAHWESQTYKYDQFVDLYDFCNRLEERMTNVSLTSQSDQQKADKVRDLCDPVCDKLEACVLVSGCSGFAYQYSYGLSIYLPWAVEKVPDNYSALEFVSDTKWDTFVNTYLEKTLRAKRDGMKDVPQILESSVEAALAALANTMITGTPAERLKKAKGLVKKMARIHGISGTNDAMSGSKYHRSRYHRSRYHRSRFPGDRERSVKNFTPVLGKVFTPPWP